MTNMRIVNKERIVNTLLGALRTIYDQKNVEVTYRAAGVISVCVRRPDGVGLFYRVHVTEEV